MEQHVLNRTQMEELFDTRQFAQLRQMLGQAEPADIADLFDRLPKGRYAALFRLIPKDNAAAAFSEMSPDLQEHLIASFSDAELRGVLEEMYLDDTVDLIEEMPANVVMRILRNAGKDREIINELLRYPKDSAGGMMTPEYVRLRQSMTVQQAFDAIRKEALDKETVYTCYVTDDNRMLEGVVDVKTLLLADPQTEIRTVMDTDVVYLHTLDDREEASQLFEKYSFLALPVVDNEQRLLGIVTFDDAMEVLQQEAEEDFAKMAAITPTEEPYLKTSVFTIWKARIPWLLILMISATFTSAIITSFEDALKIFPPLIGFIPMLMDAGGNSGSQSSVTVIRGISLGEISWRDLPRILWKELRVAILCGIALSVLTFGKILLVDRLLLGGSDITLMIDLVICLTLCLTVMSAKIIGCLLPLLAKKIGFDPAVMASPFITTLADAISLLLYFALAGLLLGI